MFNYTHPKVLVDTHWLTDHLSDANLRLIEVNLSPQKYNEGHLPGAIFWNILTDLLLPDLHLNLDPIAVEKLLTRSGITNDTTIVAYGDFSATGAWIFWLLNIFGHRDVRVLNGGRQKWIAENRSLTKEPTIVNPTQYQIKSPDDSLRILWQEVRESMYRADRVLLDVRSPQEYYGEYFMMKPPQGEERSGHIPGAVHLDYELTLNEDGTFKSFEELQALFKSKGITPDKEIIPYCAIGARSGYIWFVLKYLLGYRKVRNYDGSWNEWSQLSDAPIERT